MLTVQSHTDPTYSTPLMTITILRITDSIFMWDIEYQGFTKSQAESTLVAHIFAEKAILAALAQATDAEFLAAEFVRKPVRSLAARHTRSTSHSQRATATKQVEAEIVLEVVHSVHCLYTIQAPTASVNTFRHLFSKIRCLITNHLQSVATKNPGLGKPGLRNPHQIKPVQQSPTYPSLPCP